VLAQREGEAEIASAAAVVPALYAPASSVQTTKSCERQFNGVPTGPLQATQMTRRDLL
jgi:hypothetical protein